MPRPRPMPDATPGSVPPRFEFVVPGQHLGLLARGNIDLLHRPVVRNPDGSISTVRSVSFNVGGREVLIPTVVNGRVVSNDQALAHYRRTGQHLGMFRNAAAANRYAQLLHRQQAVLNQLAR